MSAISVSAWLLLRLTVLHVLVLWTRHGSLATIRYYYYQGDPGERGPEGPRGQPGMDGRPVSTARFHWSVRLRGVGLIGQFGWVVLL